MENIINTSILLSIIIPIYNSENFLCDCVDSLYLQNMSEEEFEILLVNDGSLDNSYAICQGLSREHTNIRLFSQKNQGQAVARNLGIEQAKGKYIMFVDSDDRLPDKVVAKMLIEAERHQTDILIGSMKVYNAQGDAAINSDFKNYNHVVSGEYALLHGYSTGSVCGRLFLNDFIKNNHLSFLSGIKHEDVIFTIKALSFAKRILSLNLCCYIYLWHEGSTDRSFDYESKCKLIFSDLIIAEEEQKFAQDIRHSKQLRDRLMAHSNSLVCSNLICMFLKYRFYKTFIPVYFKQAVARNVLPFKGKALSRNTTLLCKVINLFC